LIYSTYLGGSGNDVEGLLTDNIAVDASGFAYITGSMRSNDFPITAGAYDTIPNGASDVFVSKLSPDGSSLIYSTLIGGGGHEISRGGIALDSSGSAYVVTSTNSVNYPTTAGAYDTTFNGVRDLAVSKLSPDGSSLIYSTYLGGSGNDSTTGSDIAVDSSGSAYVVTSTTSSNYPTTVGAYDAVFNGGWDLAVSKFSPDGSLLVYSTYLGGNDIERYPSIALDINGSAHIHGMSLSANYPAAAGAFDTTYNGFYDAVVTKLNPAGSALDYSTFLGGNNNDYSFGDVFLDGSGNLHIAGATCSTNFPTVNPTQASNASGNCWDMYVSRFSGFDPGVVAGGGDITDPTIITPADVTVEATGSVTSVALGAPTVSDDVSSPANITITNDAPATFPLGATTVTWTATDEAGNSATATQNVTVEDTIPPTIMPPASQSVEAGGPLTHVLIGSATATDLVSSSLSLSNDAPAGLNFPLGATIITWSATDASGNTGTATQTVIVTDTTPPAVTAPADITVDATGVTTPVSLGAGTAVDLVDGALAPTPDNAGPYPIGTTTVTWSATDASGNTGTATQIVTVLDTSQISAGIAEDIKNLALPKGLENSLLSKLNTSLKLLSDSNPNNDSAGVNTLNALINSIQAQSGKKIAEADADALIARIQNLINLIMLL